MKALIVQGKKLQGKTKTIRLVVIVKKLIMKEEKL